MRRSKISGTAPGTFTRTLFFDLGPAPFDGLADPTSSNGNAIGDPLLDPSAEAQGQILLGSPAIDAALGSDPDGSTADLGAFGGPDSDQWDADGDGFLAWRGPGPYDPAVHHALDLDCDDGDPEQHPGADDVPGYEDDDCDGVP